MHTLHEALAWERMREARRVAERYRVSRPLAAARRWRWLASVAHAAHARHARACGPPAGCYAATAALNCRCATGPGP